VKIKTKSGEVIELTEVRASLGRGKRVIKDGLALLDALEAMLAVPITVGPQQTPEAVKFDEGLKHGMMMMRQACGVIEE
jgi:hypothetical protein